MIAIWTFIQSIPDENTQLIVGDVFQAYKMNMLKIASKILRNHHDAEDAVQEAICNITNNAEQFEDIKSQKVASLVSIYTKNAALNLYRKNQRFSQHFESFEDMDEVYIDDTDDGDVLKWLLKSENSEIIDQAIESLDEIYRQVLTLKYYYRMGNAKIAEILQIGYAQVGGRLFRARKQLLKILKEMGYEPFT